MRIRIMLVCVWLLVCSSSGVRAQQAQEVVVGTERRVALEEQPLALDSVGRTALAGQLLTKALGGTPDAPVRNARFIVENRSPFFYTYVSGSVTFYDERGVRCGEGLFTLNALAPGEQAETDAPGLRLSCAPRAWRIVAHSLLTRASESAPALEETAPLQPAAVAAPATLPLEIVVDDQVYSAPLGSTLDVPVKKRHVRITVRAAP